MPARTRRRLGILRAASASGPVLVGIDDLQWLDAASARMLEFALRRLTMEQVGVVAASLPPGPGPVPLRLEGAFGGQPPHTVVLGPMPVGELHRLVHLRLGAWLPRPVLRRVRAASGGNPFFALEMSRSLVRRGMPASTDALPVPTTIGGAPARLLSVQCPTGSGFLVESAVTIHDGTGFVFTSQNPSGASVGQDTDRATFRKFLAGIGFQR